MEAVTTQVFVVIVGLISPCLPVELKQQVGQQNQTPKQHL